MDFLNHYDLDSDDHYEHLDSSDHWFSVSGQSTRQAYRMRMCSWILRILLGHGGMPSFGEAGSAQFQAVADALGVAELKDPSCTASTVTKALQAKAKEVLDPLAQQSESNWPVQPCSMHANLQWIGSSAGLNATELAIFEFAVAMRVFRALKTVGKTWGDINRGDLPHALAAVLNLPISDVQSALRGRSTLLASGVVRLYPGGDEQLNALLFVSRLLADGIAYHQGPPQELLAHMVTPLQSEGLMLTDFAHIPQHTALARSWLEGVLAAVARGEVAGHMLVTGAPGLGKTQWCQALLRESQVQAVEMVVVNSRGGALSGEDRLHHLRMIMHMLRATPRGVILFDEADDIFRPSSKDASSGSSSGDPDAVSMDNHRAALNQLLEASRIPVIWVMNRSEVLDPAVLRRFDVEIHFDGIPRSVRLGLIQKRFASRKRAQQQPDDIRTAANDSELDAPITDAELQRWADVATLTPALIDRLAQVHDRGQEASVPMDVALSRHWICQRLPGRSIQHLRVGIGETDTFGPEEWNPDRANASVDLQELAAGIRRVGSARLALCGLPGTGKTAFAHALARILDKPLLEQRASDLLSAYVGETEQRIRNAFDLALQDDAVLFIDEVDGLLANRDWAARSWEVTQVNELLEQLGEYPGVVVIATNRIQAIDPAALRRLDMQITFEPLRPHQVKQGFAALCKASDIDLSELELQRASHLKGVTPGDFAALARRLRFAPDARTAQNVLALLQDLLDSRQPVRAPMGFTNGNPSDTAGI